MVRYTIYKKEFCVLKFVQLWIDQYWTHSKRVQCKSWFSEETGSPMREHDIYVNALNQMRRWPIWIWEEPNWAMKDCSGWHRLHLSANRGSVVSCYGLCCWTETSLDRNHGLFGDEWSRNAIPRCCTTTFGHWLYNEESLDFFRWRLPINLLWC